MALSKETKKAVDDAIAAHIQNEAQGMVVGYVAYIALMNSELDAEGVTGYRFIRADGQMYHATLGLIHSMAADFTSKPSK